MDLRRARVGSFAKISNPEATVYGVRANTNMKEHVCIETMWKRVGSFTSICPAIYKYKDKINI